MKRSWMASLGLLVFALTLFLGLAGCGKEPPPPPPPPAEEPPPPPPPPPPPHPPPPPEPTEAELFQRASVTELQRNLNDVHFDYDQSTLRDDARAALSKNSDWLKLSYNTAVIEVEGHCDNRGTDQYNLALGERRARAAMEYLQSLGIPANRLKMVSFGEERPQCNDETESCWQRNRRAHFRIDAK